MSIGVAQREGISMIVPVDIGELRKWDTPTLCNAVELLRIRDRTSGFLGRSTYCLFPELGPVVGFAVTARYDSTTPGAPPSSNLLALLRAVALAAKPAVIVMKDASDEPERSCGFGEVMAATTKALGAIGLVTDGNVRDVEEARRLCFHYFAAGIVPAHGNLRILDVNAPVMLGGGTEVRPGDLVHGDLNGVAFFPVDRIDELIKAAARVRERETRIVRVASDEGATLEGIRTVLDHP
jgi:4-hydroxy-4-methyl-2-oxoglutarate aldolase